MLAYEFMQNALLAGSAVALACGLVGYLVVVRGEVFAGDALSHVAFTGALAAAAAGLDVRIGLFSATLAVAVAMAAIGERAHADDVVIGSLFAWVLGLGTLFLAIFTARSSATNGVAGVRVLFGSILGLSREDVWLAAAIALLACAVVLAIARPLLFASLDPGVAAAQGVPVRLLALLFLGVVGITSAEATQAVGALLLLGLLAAPAGAAALLVSSPYAGMALAAALALVAVWSGLALAYAIPALPPSSAIVGVAVACYGAAGALAWMRGAASAAR